MSRRVWSIAFVVAFVLPLVAATAGGSGADALTLYVTFRLGPQRIMVTLANGSPVGTTSGAPTVIPAGFYTLAFDDSAAVEGPTFDLTGPGVNVSENMFYGEIPSATLQATFQPSSTYTWRNDEQPSAVFTFATTATSGGTAASGSTPAISTGSTSKTGTPSSDIVGSAVVPFRGTLAALVDAAGKLTLTSKGKPLTTLRSGLYTFTVVDRSAKSGFAIERFVHGVKPSVITLTGVGYMGTHVATIDLKPGQWTYFTPGGKKTYFIAS